MTKVGEAKQIEGLLDPASHDIGGEADRLHAVGKLVLDHVGHEAGKRVLRHDPDDIGKLAGRVQTGVSPGDGDPTGQCAASEVGDETVDATEQCGLARPGATDHEHQLALRHV